MAQPIRPARPLAAEAGEDDESFRIDIEELRRISHRSSWRGLTHVALEWLAIVGAALLCERFWHPGLYVATVLFLAGRQHALGILMHEGAHFLISPRRALNDWVSDVFLAWPVTLSMSTYRAHHGEHHRHTNTEQDPDCVTTRKLNPREWNFPTSRGVLAWAFVKDLLGISIFRAVLVARELMLEKAESKAPAPGWNARLVVRLAYYAAILGASVYFGFWKAILLYWVVPFVTAFQLILRVRALAEHFGTPNDHELNISRSTIASGWERIFMPHNINLHLEHHLYPSVPSYRLPELHRALLAKPAFRQRAHVTRGYVAVLRECVHGAGPARSCISHVASTPVEPTGEEHAAEVA